MSRLSPVRLATISLLVTAAAGVTAPAEAQITNPRISSASRDRHDRLQEQLINRLRATTGEQQGFLKFVVEQVEKGRLSFRLVVAVERYALKRNSHLPFLFFARALRYEASKRGVGLPPVRQFATTRPDPPRAP